MTASLPPARPRIPLPLGEGLGEGSPAASPTAEFVAGAMPADPSPDPLPQGEGGPPCILRRISFTARRSAIRRRVGNRAPPGRSGRLYPLAVLPVEMPLLRFQLPCPGGGRHSGLAGGISQPDPGLRGADRAAARDQPVFRRRHAQPDAAANRGRDYRPAVAEAWTLERDAEITLEANPAAVDRARFAGFAAAGVNRVSIGVQSFDDRDLQFLGRNHSAADARRALRLARRHFGRFSFDLIYALPGADHGGLADSARRSPRRGRRPSLALPTHDRAGHRVPRAMAARRPGNAGRRYGRSPVRNHPGGDGCRRPAGLRNFQPRPPRRGIAPQPGLLALWRLCRDRPRRPRPADARRRAPRHPASPRAGSVAGTGAAGGRSAGGGAGQRRSFPAPKPSSRR